MIRPRGWHLSEKHFTIDGERVSASLFDFGLYLFHNGRESLSAVSGRTITCRNWRAISRPGCGTTSCRRRRTPGAGSGTIRATVLIETITAAFEMDEILYELRPHVCGLNAGRWDYIFSIAKRFHTDPAFVLPDRSSVTMTSSFMRAYTELLVKTRHQRGAHAIGGMSNFIPNRRKPDVTEVALAKVTEDKKPKPATASTAPGWPTPIW